MVSEQMVREQVSTLLKNKGWVLDYSSPECNVSQEEKNADYVLKDDNSCPLLVLEVKTKKNFNISKAFEQAKKYAIRLKAPIIGITDGENFYYKHVQSNQNLIYNGIELKNTVLEQDLLKKFIDNPICFELKQDPQTRAFILKVFNNINDLLSKIHVFKGIPRLQQICNFLFLKLFHDSLKEKKAKKEINKIYNWDKLIKKNKNNDEDLISFYNTMLEKLQSKYCVSINLFEESVFNVYKEEHLIILKKIIEEINKINFFTSNNNDLHGEAFEFFLEINSSIKQSDLGQYFTPRPIVNFMVDFANLKVETHKKIYDPFCGTGGFLIKAFSKLKEQILNPHKLNLAKTQDLKKEMQHLKKECLYGQEAVMETARFAKMNMILAGDGHSNISCADSFSLNSKQEHNEKYDVILTNIPFLNKQYSDFEKVYDCINGNEISIRHCLNSINSQSLDNKILIIVPESVLIDNRYYNLRKYIHEITNIVAVISLPIGSFIPYAPNAKTSILILNQIKKNKIKLQEEFLYFEVKNIGYRINTERTVIPEDSDLDLFLKNFDFDILEQYKQTKLKSLLPEQTQFVPLCVKNSNLIFKPQINLNDYWKTTFPMKPLSSLIQETIYKREDKEYKTWSVTNDRGFILRSDNPTKSNVNSKNNSKEKIICPFHFAYNPATINVGSICFNNSDKKGCVSSSYVVFKNKNTEIIKNEFLFLIFKSEPFLKLIKKLVESLRATVRGKCDFEHFSNILIPIPSIPQQNEIINLAQETEKKEKKLKLQIKENKKHLQDKINSFLKN